MRSWSAFDRRDISDQLIAGKNSIEVKVTSPESPRFGQLRGVCREQASGPIVVENIAITLAIPNRGDGRLVPMPMD